MITEIKVKRTMHPAMAAFTSKRDELGGVFHGNSQKSEVTNIEAEIRPTVAATRPRKLKIRMTTTCLQNSFWSSEKLSFTCLHTSSTEISEEDEWVSDPSIPISLVDFICHCVISIWYFVFIKRPVYS